jgi:esterase/lipase superfamily enzyme
MFLLTTGELIADIVAMAGIYCLGTFFRELLNSDIMAYLMIPVDYCY